MKSRPLTAGVAGTNPEKPHRRQRSRDRWRGIRRDFWLGVVNLGNQLPRPVARGCGKAVGCLVWLLMRTERERAVERIRAALRHSEAESASLARRCSMTMGAYLADAVRLEVWSPEELRRVIRLDGLHHPRRAMSPGDGVFILSAHIGNWEILAAAIAAAGIPFSVVARQPRDPVLARRLEALRERWGIESLWRDDGPRPILRALRAGRAVGVLIDQATGNGEGVPFFGRAAHTPTGPARIAIRTGVPVVPVHCVDGPNGTYIGVFEPPLVGEVWERDDPVALTGMWTRHIERWIRQAPHAWVWMHDRWRSATAHQSAVEGVSAESGNAAPLRALSERAREVRS